MPFGEAALVPVTISTGTSLSGGGAIGSATLVGLDVPTITSAALTFQVSIDGTTYREALDSGGSAVTIGATTGNRFFQAPAALAGAPYIKVRSGTSGAPVNQTPAVTITLVVA